MNSLMPGRPFNKTMAHFYIYSTSKSSKGQKKTSLVWRLPFCVATQSANRLPFTTGWNSFSFHWLRVVFWSAGRFHHCPPSKVCLGACAIQNFFEYFCTVHVDVPSLTEGNKVAIKVTSGGLTHWNSLWLFLPSIPGIPCVSGPCPLHLWRHIGIAAAGYTTSTCHTTSNTTVFCFFDGIKPHLPPPTWTLVFPLNMHIC